MKITAQKIKDQLRQKWPIISFMWLPDKTYWMPTIKEVRDTVSKCQIHKAMIFKDDIADCDDFALQLHAEVKRLCNTAGLGVHWPFGEAFGLKWQGLVEQHTANIAVTLTGIYLIEPQTNEIWQADSNKDQILLVKM